MTPGTARKETGRRRSASRLLPLLAPALLVLIGLHQVFLARTEGLSPWKGGGFGMFSSTDRGPARFLRAVIIREGGEERVPVPPELAALERRAVTYPSRPLLGELARRTAAGRSGPAQAVRIELWRAGLDLRSRELRRWKVRELLVPLGVD